MRTRHLRVRRRRDIVPVEMPPTTGRPLDFPSMEILPSASSDVSISSDVQSGRQILGGPSHKNDFHASQAADVKGVLFWMCFS